MSSNKEIIRLAIPNIVSNISVPLISSVDTALMGHLSITHLAAVGIGSMVFNFLYWNFGFLRMGTTGMTAQDFGRNDDAAIARNLYHAILLSLTIGCLIVLIKSPFSSLSAYLMQIDPSQIDLFAAYFDIRIWAAPVTLSLIACMGWLFGMQNAIYPLVITLVINTANIIFSSYFVLSMDMGIKGVAYGTVLSQSIGLLLALALIFYKYRSIVNHIAREYQIRWEKLLRFLSINGDLFIRTFCLTLVFAFIYSQSSAYGVEVLAINTILLQFLNWMSFGVDGFAYAAESLVGKYKGKESEQGMMRTIRLSMVWGMGLALCYSIIYYLFDQPLIQLFSNDQQVTTKTMTFFLWIVITPLLATPSYIWDGIFVGLTAVKAMRNTMIVSMGLFFMVYYTSIVYFEPIDTLWMSLLVFLMARGIIQWIFFKKWGTDIT